MNLALAVCILVFILIFVLRMPISLGMIAAGGAYLIVKGADLSMVSNQVINALYTNFVIIAVPLFIFTANIMNSGKVSNLIFNFAKSLIGRVRGALGYVNVVDSIVFSGMTGSAIACAAALSKIEIKAMSESGFDPEFACAVSSTSAILGTIYPPSIPLILYAMLSSTSVGALFLGGVIPATILAIALMVYVGIVSNKRKYPRGERLRLKVFLRQTLVSIPALLTPVVLLAGIYTGVMTPTEAGAAAGFYAILITVIAYRAMGPKDLLKAAVNSLRDIGAISLIVGAAAIISYIFAREQIAVTVGNWIISITSSKWSFLLMTNIALLIIGLAIDTSIILLIFVPILLPVATALGVDLIHFGVVVVFNCMIGLCTPPFGILLFITSSVSGTPLKKVIREIWLPVFAMIIVLFILTYIPITVTFFPKLAGLM